MTSYSSGNSAAGNPLIKSSINGHIVINPFDSALTGDSGSVSSAAPGTHIQSVNQMTNTQQPGQFGNQMTQNSSSQYQAENQLVSIPNNNHVNQWSLQNPPQPSPPALYQQPPPPGHQLQSQLQQQQPPPLQRQQQQPPPLNGQQQQPPPMQGHQPYLSPYQVQQQQPPLMQGQQQPPPMQGQQQQQHPPPLQGYHHHPPPIQGQQQQPPPMQGQQQQQPPMQGQQQQQPPMQGQHHPPPPMQGQQHQPLMQGQQQQQQPHPMQMQQQHPSPSPFQAHYQPQQQGHQLNESASLQGQQQPPISFSPHQNQTHVYSDTTSVKSNSTPFDPNFNPILQQQQQHQQRQQHQAPVSSITPDTAKLSSVFTSPATFTPVEPMFSVLGPPAAAPSLSSAAGQGQQEEVDDMFGVFQTKKEVPTSRFQGDPTPLEISAHSNSVDDGISVLSRSTQGTKRLTPKSRPVPTSLFDDVTFAPPPRKPKSLKNSQYLAKTLSRNSSPLPNFDNITHSGNILSRISFRTIIMKKWKPTFWISLGNHELYFFRSYNDFEDWVSNPYLTKPQRDFLIKMKIDLIEDLKKSSVRGYQTTNVRLKAYSHKAMNQFKLERWMDYGPTIAAAFAAEDERDIHQLRTIMLEMMKLSPKNRVLNVNPPQGVRRKSGDLIDNASGRYGENDTLRSYNAHQERREEEKQRFQIRTNRDENASSYLPSGLNSPSSLNSPSNRFIDSSASVGARDSGSVSSARSGTSMRSYGVMSTGPLEQRRNVPMRHDRRGY